MSPNLTVPQASHARQKEAPSTECAMAIEGEAEGAQG
jgi:hypothetical protein